MCVGSPVLHLLDAEKVWGPHYLRLLLLHRAAQEAALLLYAAEDAATPLEDSHS